MKKFFISPGDPAGIGPEITLRALSENKSIQKYFVLAGDRNSYQDLIEKNNTVSPLEGTPLGRWTFGTI